MPNGSEPFAEFDWLEAPLRCIDAAVSRFVRDKEARLVRNYHYRPARDIESILPSGVHVLVGISPVQDEGVGGWKSGKYSYRVNAMVFEGIGRNRRFAHREVAKLRPDDVDEGRVIPLLEDAWNLAPSLVAEMK